MLQDYDQYRLDLDACNANGGHPKWDLAYRYAHSIRALARRVARMMRPNLEERQAMAGWGRIASSRNGRQPLPPFQLSKPCCHDPTLRLPFTPSLDTPW